MANWNFLTATEWDVFTANEWEAFEAPALAEVSVNNEFTISWFNDHLVPSWNTFTAGQWNEFTADDWDLFDGFVPFGSFIWNGSTSSWKLGANWLNDFVTTAPVDDSTVLFNDASVQDCTLDINTAILGSLTFLNTYTGIIRPDGFNISIHNGDLTLGNNMSWVKSSGIITISGTGVQTLDIRGFDTETIHIDK